MTDLEKQNYSLQRKIDYLFFMAVNTDNLEMTKTCLEKNFVDVNVGNLYGNTALHLACNNANLEMVRLLLKNGADANIANELNHRPISYIPYGEDELRETLKVAMKTTQHINKSKEK